MRHKVKKCLTVGAALEASPSHRRPLQVGLDPCLQAHVLLLHGVEGVAHRVHHLHHVDLAVWQQLQGGQKNSRGVCQVDTQSGGTWDFIVIIVEITFYSSVALCFSSSARKLVNMCLYVWHLCPSISGNTIWNRSLLFYSVHLICTCWDSAVLTGKKINTFTYHRQFST